MQSLVRSKSILGVLTLALVSSFSLNFVSLAVVSGRAQAASLAQGFAARGELDCNGYSKIQQPLKRNFPCADLTGQHGERSEDNGHYIGHDEPSMQYLSNAPGSGNNVRWKMTLPHEHALPATQSFENFATFWFSMALCEPQSYPLHPCTPDSDKNPPARFSNDSRVAGSAFLELQFYPPGFYPFLTQLSCDARHWCAAMTIDSLKCDPAATSCNSDCVEPTNFAFIQIDGIPTGPPGPASSTNATFTPNSHTLLMNKGDSIEVTMHDTSQGVENRVVDKTTGQQGYMVASAANGFQSLNVATCAPTGFNYHPEYSTAKRYNVDSWTFLEANIGIAYELGHFEAGSKPDHDGDDATCFPGPLIPGCLSADTDYDGTSYQKDWPDGSHNTPASLLLRPPDNASKAGAYNLGYPSLMFETEVLSTESACKSNGNGCTVPPAGASFYPFYAQAGRGTNCVMTFGNDLRGSTLNDFGRDAEYGHSDRSWYFGTANGGVRTNPCLS